MAMTAAHHRWTRAEVVALIDASPLATPRYELVDGELFVTPSPIGPHQKAVRELLVELAAYLRRSPVAEVLSSPFDVELEPETIVQPDVFVVPVEEGRRLATEMPAHQLLLAAEVISPGSARGDRGRKRALFQRRMPEYWIVDLDARLIERWRPREERPEILRDRLEWKPEGATEPFRVELGDFFSRVSGSSL